LIAALWLGSAFFLMLAASAAFKAAPDRTAAADVVGAMLTRWHYIALAAPLLFVLEMRRVRRFALVVLFIAVMLAAAQAFVDLRIRTIRWSSPIPISSLPVVHPTRRLFGALHGISMTLLALQTLAAAIVVISKSQKKEEPSVMSARNDEEEDKTNYQVVMNDEEQYSIWPADRDVPLGWRAAGKTGTKRECLAYIEDVWTDMRPLSLRKKMEEMERERGA
jgi:MbtH protein